MAKRKKDASKECTPEELKRRQMQRELQALAMKLKSEGGVYKPQKHKRKVFKEQQKEAGIRVKSRGSKKTKEKKSKHDTPKWRPLNKTDVVIIPIYWNMHHEEKASVLSAAEKVSGLLQEAGISCTTDAANQYTPGQKMKYWETAGVRVRVELGPKDATAGTAVVARAGEPGTVAAKTTVNVTVQLVREVKKALQEMGVHTSNQQKSSQQQHEEEEEEEEEGVNAQASESQEEPEQEEQQADESDEQLDEEEEEQAGSDDEQAVDADSDEGDAGSSSGGEEEAAAGKAAGAPLSRKQARKEKKRQAAAAKSQAPAAGNIQPGSRRDRKRKAKMAALGLDKAAEEQGEEEAGANEGQKKQRKQSSKQSVEVVESGEQSDGDVMSDDGDDVQHESAPASRAHQGGAKSAGANGVSGDGDELEDDFQIDPAFMPEPEEEALTLTKVQRLKKQKKADKARRKQQRFGSGKAWDATEEEETVQKQPSKAGKSGKPKGPKVVVF